jgi:hypothetical protein
MNTSELNRTTRREFLRTSGTAVAAAALAGAISSPGYAAEKNTIKVALVGCGGRGTGAAAQALSTSGPTKLWAMADVFEHRLQSSFGSIRQAHEKQVDVPRTVRKLERRSIRCDCDPSALPWHRVIEGIARRAGLTPR